MRGYLTGSLDLVVRVRDADDGPTGSPSLTTRPTGSASVDRRSTLADYHPTLVAAEMQRRHYSLQALLYLVALYRYLRWRVRG